MRGLQRGMDALTKASVRSTTRAVQQAVRDASKVSQAVARTAARTHAEAMAKTLGQPSAKSGAKSGTKPTTKLSPKPSSKPSSKRRRVATKPSAARPARTASSRLPAGCTAALAVTLVGTRRYLLYTPPGLVRRTARTPAPPLVVMLHGCGQDARSFALSTRMNRVAAREGFLVLYPEQDRLHHPQGCWNWFALRSGQAKAEAGIILGAIDQVCLLHRADPSAVAVVGLSAGAGMASLLAARHPTRFRAVVMHSGVAAGAAESTATALEAMRGRRRPAPLDAHPDADPLPPLLVIHGDADPLVAPSNSGAAAALWAEAVGAQAQPARVVARGNRRPMTVTDYVIGDRLAARQCEVAGLGHAWSGGDARQAFSDPTGPDAARLAWAFVAAQLAATDR